jgi:hypothetical protein
MGIGMSNHLVLDLPLISVKYHQDSKNSYSGLFGVNSTEDEASYAVGFRYFRNIFKEKNINFYNSIGLSLFSYTMNTEDKSGYQLDWSFGSEFAFEKLESLGLSFEFGLSAVDYLGKKSIRTNANNFIKSAIHFYL